MLSAARVLRLTPNRIPNRSPSRNPDLTRPDLTRPDPSYPSPLRVNNLLLLPQLQTARANDSEKPMRNDEQPDRLSPIARDHQARDRCRGGNR